MSAKIKNSAQFQYYLEDTDCEFCLHFKRQNGQRARVCVLNACCCEDTKRDAVVHGRIEREQEQDT